MDARFCDYCKGRILVGQRWVRERIYDRQFGNNDPAYLRFHAEPIGGQDVNVGKNIGWNEKSLERQGPEQMAPLYKG